tara:strand:- start:1950 stop:2684 length:735 start_codon:yes stop_codon:yes gene_type:complete
MKKRIDLILLEKKIIETRSKANAMIMAGQVFVNDKIVKKSGELFNVDEIIKVKKIGPQWVSRGSLKLLHAINSFKIKIDNLTCLDIGASTGGFTEVLLNRNAKKIYAIDVGYNQLHERLKKEKKIINIEKTNARYIDKTIIKDPIDLIVCDVSFISLKKVIKPALIFLKKKSGIIIALIKPQFEANKKEVRKGGIIIDNAVKRRICSDIENWFSNECNLKVQGIIESPIKKTKGNIEFLIVAKN